MSVAARTGRLIRTFYHVIITTIMILIYFNVTIPSERTRKRHRGTYYFRAINPRPQAHKTVYMIITVLLRFPKICVFVPSTSFALTHPRPSSLFFSVTLVFRSGRSRRCSVFPRASRTPSRTDFRCHTITYNNNNNINNIIYVYNSFVCVLVPFVMRTEFEPLTGKRRRQKPSSPKRSFFTLREVRSKNVVR